MTLPRFEYDYFKNKNFIIFPEKKGLKKRTNKTNKFKLKRKKITKKHITKKHNKTKSIFGFFK
jgi:hypothetical protein